MDIHFCRLFHPELKHLNSKQMMQKISINPDNYIISIQHFMKKFPDFNINLYKGLYKQCSNLNNIELLCHYYQVGKGQNYISSLSQFSYAFPYFDSVKYLEYNKDIKEQSVIDLMIDFYHKNQMYEMYNHYDKHFINIFYQDISENEIITDLYYRHNNRYIRNSYYFYLEYPNFQLNIYKMIIHHYLEKPFTSDVEYIAYWYYNGDRETKRYDSIMSQSSSVQLDYYNLYHWKDREENNETEFVQFWIGFTDDEKKKYVLNEESLKSHLEELILFFDKNVKNNYECDTSEKIINKLFSYQNVSNAFNGKEKIMDLEVFLTTYPSFSYYEFIDYYPTLKNIENQWFVYQIYHLLRDTETLIGSYQEFKEKFPFFENKILKKIYCFDNYSDDENSFINYDNQNYKETVYWINKCVDEVFFNKPVPDNFHSRIYLFFVREITGFEEDISNQSLIFHFFDLYSVYGENLVFSKKSYENQSIYKELGLNIDLYRHFQKLTFLSDEDVIIDFHKHNKMNESWKNDIVWSINQFYKIYKGFSKKLFDSINIDLNPIEDENDFIFAFLNHDYATKRIWSIETFYSFYPSLNNNIDSVLQKIKNIDSVSNNSKLNNTISNNTTMNTSNINFLSSETDKIIYWMKEGFYKYQEEQTNGKIKGRTSVNHVFEALLDVEYYKKVIYPLKKGISLIIRAKNEESNVPICIESIVEHVDEIIFVDNNSTDNTYLLVNEYSKKYPYINVYQYNIQVSKAGKDHREAIAQNNKNTLGLFYNWCLSKSSKKNVVKWDADFIGIPVNWNEMVKLYNLREREDAFSVWFTGKTCFENNDFYYIDFQSFYNEFRIFSYANGFQWYDGEICEYTEPYLNTLSDEKKIRYPFPIFYELKRTRIDEFSERSSFIDERDRRDHRLLENLKKNELQTSLKNVSTEHIMNVKNNKSELIWLYTPSFSYGGGNQFILHMYDFFKTLGYQCKIIPIYQSVSGKEKFTNVIPSDVLDILTCKKKIFEQKPNKILFNSDIPFVEEDLKKISYFAELYFVTHSDVAYSNYFVEKYYNYFKKIITVNDYMIDKLCSIINKDEKTRLFIQTKMESIVNYVSTTPEKISFLSSNIQRKKNCFGMISRFSIDKNVPMILEALVPVFNEYPDMKFYLVGSGDSKEYDSFLVEMTNLLNIKKNVFFEGFQKDPTKYYFMFDFILLASVSEGCPYNLLEAMTYNTPIITTNVGGNHEIVYNNDNGILIDYKNIRNLEKKTFFIRDYKKHLEEIGYISGSENFQKKYKTIRPFSLDVYSPTFLIPLCRFCKKCQICKEYFEKKSLWEEEKKKITDAVLQMIRATNETKEKYVQESNKKVKEKYNENNYVSQLFNIFF